MTTDVKRRDKTFVLLMVGIFLAALGAPWLLYWTHPVAGRC